MKKSILLSLTAAMTVVTLSGCSTMAQLQLQKKQLSDGSAVTIAHNLPPTSDWGCKEIGTRQAYNWAMLETQGQFNIKGAHGMLADKAVSYANQQGLKPNYINLQIPEGKTFTTGYGNFTSSRNRNPGGMAVASYYQCQRINPQNKIGWQKKTDTAILINADDSQAHIAH